MKRESSDQRKRLLEDVLADDSFPTFEQGVKERALRELRRARFVRRVGAASALVAILIVAGGAALMFSGSHERRPVASAAAALQPTVAVPAAVNPEKGTITEAQLVALFPPDSCFVAEVNGKKELVFRSEEMKRKYLF